MGTRELADINLATSHNRVDQRAVFQEVRTQIPDGAARLEQAAPGHVARKIEHLPGDLWRLVELVGHRFQLDGDGRQFLFERVVEFARDAGPLLQHGFALEFLLDDGRLLAHAAVQDKYPGEPRQQDHCHDPQHPEQARKRPPRRILHDHHVIGRAEQQLEGFGPGLNGGVPILGGLRQADSGQFQFAPVLQAVEAAVGFGRVHAGAENQVLRLQDHDLLVAPLHAVHQAPFQADQFAVVILGEQLIDPDVQRRGRRAMAQAPHHGVFQDRRILTHPGEPGHRNNVPWNQQVCRMGLDGQTLRRGPE